MEFTKEQKVYAEIVQKAWDDTEFKKELTSNPVGAIEKLTGKKMTLPAGKTLVVRDQTDESTVYINIPAKPEVNAELNEEQLELVAGGVIGNCFPDIINFPGGNGPYNPLPPIFEDK